MACEWFKVELPLCWSLDLVLVIYECLQMCMSYTSVSILTLLNVFSLFVFTS